MYKVYNALIEIPVTPIYTLVNKLQQLIDKSGVVCKIQRFITVLQRLEAALTVISKANIDMQGLVIVDNYCPGNVVVKGVCSSLNTVVKEAVTVMQSLKEVGNTITTFLNIFAWILQEFSTCS